MIRPLHGDNPKRYTQSVESGVDRTSRRGDEPWTAVGRTRVRTTARLSYSGYPWLNPQHESCLDLREPELSPVSTDLTKTAENNSLETDPELLLTCRQAQRA